MNVRGRPPLPCGAATSLPEAWCVTGGRPRGGEETRPPSGDQLVADDDDPLAGFILYEKAVMLTEGQGPRRPRFVSPPKPPIITLCNDAGLSIGINEVAYAALGRPAALLLLWHPTRRAMGLRAADAEDENAYLVQHHNQRGRSHRITPRAFRQRWGLDQMSTTRFSGRMVKDVLVVELAAADRQRGSGR